jgi:hypothetical protein
MEAPLPGTVQEQFQAMFGKMGIAITSLTSQVALMTVSSQSTTDAVKKFERKPEEMEKNMQQIVAQRSHYSQSSSSKHGDVRFGSTEAVSWQLGPYDQAWGAQPAPMQT